jgi:hypothetical protein
MIDQIVRFFADGTFGLGAVLTFVVLVIIIGVALYAVGAMTWAYLRAGRTKIWLKGTILVERRIVLRRHIDLRTAQVELRPSANANVASLSLVATDQRSGKSLELLIQEGQATLPTSELAALAEAILGDHNLVLRVDHDHVAAMIVANRLRELAVTNT